MIRAVLKYTVAGLLILLLVAAAAYHALMNTGAGASWVVSNLRDSLPGVLSVDDVQGSLASGLTLENLRYSDSTMAVSAQRAFIAVSLDFRPVALRVRSLRLSAVRYQVLDSGNSEEQEPISDSFTLPFAVHLEQAEVEGFTFIDAQDETLIEGVSLAVRASAERRLHIDQALLRSGDNEVSFEGDVVLERPFAFDLRLRPRAALEAPETLGVTTFEADLHLQGVPDEYTLDASGRVTPAEWGAHAFRIRSAGSLSGLNISLLELEGPVAELQSQAEVDWVDRFIGLSGFELAVPDSPVRLAGDVALDFDGVLQGEIAWNELSWPLASADPDFDSREGRVSLSGTLDNWQMTGRAEVSARDLPSGVVSLDAAGNRDHVDIRQLSGEALGGVLQGSGSWRWTEPGEVSARMTMTDIDTTVFYPEMPAVVSAEFQVQGILQPLDLTVDIDSLQTTVRGQAINASGGLHLQPETYGFRNLNITARDARLTLNGNPKAENGIAFHLDVGELAQFLPQGAGSIEARGSYAAASGHPQVSLELQGSNLAWNGLQAARVDISDSDRSPGGQIAALQIELTRPQYDGYEFERVAIDLDLQTDSQSVEFSADGYGHVLGAALQGRMALGGEPLADWPWEGEISRLELTQDGQDRLRLEQPASLTIGQPEITLSTACFVAIRDSRVCMDANWKAGSGLATSVTLTGLPLSQLSGWFSEDVVFTQSADGKAALRMDEKGLFGTVDFELTPGQVYFADEEAALFSTGKSELGFRLEAGAVSAGHADIPIVGQGEIDFDFSLSEVDRGLDAPLHGDLRIDLADLDVFSIFLPLADEMAGRFNSELQLSGTAGNPHFSGFLSLDEGRIVNMASGLTLSEIQLSGNVTGNDETRLFGSFRAAEGHGELEANLDFSDLLSPRVSLGVSGENLTLLKSKKLTVVADPDIHLAWQNNALEIDGRLVIPRAKVAPDVIPVTRATESRDLEIVAGASPETESASAPANDMSLSGKLEVVLGDAVTVDLDLAEFGVSGDVEFSWRDKLIPVATGNYSMSGEILAYGQLLEISEGNIGFPQVPADNPYLNIRAERRIFGNSEIRRAGVLITGTLKRPVVEPYTDPMTNRERAQTLLVTGSDFNMERGVGAVDIGTYIAPRVFVSYGIGVFEDENVIGIRYDLGSNWGIKATSGERQTGLDISYTLER